MARVTIQPGGRRAVTLTRDGKPLQAGDIKDGEMLSISLADGETYAVMKAGNRKQRRAAFSKSRRNKPNEQA